MFQSTLIRDGINLSFQDTAGSNATLYLDIANTRVGVNANNLSATFQVGGNVLADAITATGNIEAQDSLLSSNLVSGGEMSISSAASGNILIDAAGYTRVVGTDAFYVPVGNSVQRPASPEQGAIRFNTTTSAVEFWDGTDWVSTIPSLNVITNQTIDPDGSTSTFVLDQASTAESILVTINGLNQTPVVDYTVSSNNITFTTTPIQTDTIQIRYIATTSTVTAIVNANSYVQINGASSNVDITVNGTLSAEFANTGVYVTDLYASGNITGSYIIGNGSALTSINGSNVTGTVANTTYAISAGTVTTAAQPNITSVGTLSSLTVTGNITGGNLITAGLISATGNITGGNVSGTLLTGTLSTAAQPNVTSVGTLSSLSVTGNTTSGNFVGTLNGSGANISSINANNISSGTLASARLSGTYTITVSGASTTAGTVTTNAQPNITSVGILSSLDVTGNVTVDNLFADGFVSVQSISKIGANGVGNIGDSANTFNTIFAKATSAQYADLAEMYAADANYESGTVLVFGGSKEVTISTLDGSQRVAGVVSEYPAYLMNSHIDAEYTAVLALQGRVPVKVLGPVYKGDMMVSAFNGYAQACATPAMGSVIGKALEDFAGTTGIIEVVVGRL